MRRMLCSIVAALVLLAAPATASAKPTDGYEYANAPCQADTAAHGKTDGTGYWCYDYNWGDSSRGFGKRNCTDYVAFKLGWRGDPFPAHHGNAIDWLTYADRAGLSNVGALRPAV